jgi:hypothetical protein
MAVALPAAALDREGAIEKARDQVKAKCVPATACTFNAKLDSNKWYVRVEYSGGKVIFIIDQTGKVVGRMEGK